MASCLATCRMNTKQSKQGKNTRNWKSCRQSWKRADFMDFVLWSMWRCGFEKKTLETLARCKCVAWMDRYANECDYSVGSAGHSNVRAAMKRNPRSALATTKTKPRNNCWNLLNRKTKTLKKSKSEILKPSALDPLQASAPVTQPTAFEQKVSPKSGTKNNFFIFLCQKHINQKIKLNLRILEILRLT